MEKRLKIYTSGLNAREIYEGMQCNGYEVKHVEEDNMDTSFILNAFNMDVEMNNTDSMYLDWDIDNGKKAYAPLDVMEVEGTRKIEKIYWVIVEVKEPKEEPVKEYKEETWPSQEERGEKANYEIMVGLNDKDSHQQEVSTQEAIETIGTLLGSCTIQQCIGFYMGEQETSIKVTVYGQRFKEMKSTCQEIRRRLNQECVILTNIKEQESTFIYE